jgi:hypothetical protein
MFHTNKYYKIKILPTRKGSIDLEKKTIHPIRIFIAVDSFWIKNASYKSSSRIYDR